MLVTSNGNSHSTNMFFVKNSLVTVVTTKTSAGVFSVTLRFRSRQQHLFKDSLGLIKRQIYHPGLIMKIGHEEASEKKKQTSSTVCL